MVRRLVLLHAVNDGGEDLVGLLLQTPVVNVGTDVANGFQGSFFPHLGAVDIGHILKQDLLKQIQHVNEITNHVRQKNDLVEVF